MSNQRSGETDGPPWMTEENLPIFSINFCGVIAQRNKKVEKTS